MNIKKNISTLAVLAATQTLSASYNHYFYAGVALNVCSMPGKRSDSATNDTPVTAIFADKKAMRPNGVYGGGFAEYLLRVGNFGVGPSVFYSHGKAEDKDSRVHNDPAGPLVTTFDLTHKITNQAGAHLRLGYFLDSYFLYGLFGTHYQAGQFVAHANHTDGAGDTNLYDYKTKKKNAHAFSYGFGVQKTIAENYAIGFECKFANFSKKDFKWTLPEPNNTTLNSSFKYKLCSFGLKLMYVF